MLNLSHRVEAGDEDVQGANGENASERKVVENQRRDPVFFLFQPTITEQVERHREQGHNDLQQRLRLHP